MQQLGTLGLMLVLTRACAQSGEPYTPDAGAQSEVEVYTDEELTALREREDVKRREEPFGNDVPAADEARYITMPDGVRIAVSFYYPEGFDPEHTRAPTVYSETWYTRGGEAHGVAIELYRKAGFVVAIADPRGFGASFGWQEAYLTEAQRDDQRSVVRFISEQRWSNGQVAAIGISVSGMLAEAALASGAPSIQAGIVRGAEWDQYAENLFPGGIPNLAIHGLISGVLELNRGEPCLQDIASCAEYGPVGGDALQLQAAFRDHQHNVTGAALEGLSYADETINGYDFRDVSPMGHARELAEHALPARVAVSWLDGATAQAALARFNTLSDVPMQVSIAATTHMGGLDADPFAREPFQPARTAPEVWFGEDIEFLTHALAHEEIQRKVDYYVLGADTWKSTDVWPPRGVQEQTLHLSERGLQRRAADSGEREYEVDPETSSGKWNRWDSGDNTPIFFGDRRAKPGVRASFDAEPVSHDAELVGAPELCLAMRSDQSDGAVFAYLEDVAPDGRVTYLTEGLLRLIHRKTARGGCDSAPGTERSFEREDAQPVVPYELMQVEIPLLPVAARIEAGHHLRLSLAGADKDTFPLLTETPPTWEIAYHGSSLRVPLRPWK